MAKTRENGSLPQLSPTELEVMKVLWTAERMAAREVHEHLAERQGWAYSTTRTTIERLVKKGCVEKRAFHGLHLYGARISRATGLARLVQEFARQVLETTEVPVASLFAESGALSADEVAELESILAEDGR